jgi:hypothetical protein
VESFERSEVHCKDDEPMSKFRGESVKGISGGTEPAVTGVKALESDNCIVQKLVRGRGDKAQHLISLRAQSKGCAV